MSGYTLETCPRRNEHTPMPVGYVAWHLLAEKREQAGQRQYRCQGCGLYAIWEGGRSVKGWPRRQRRDEADTSAAAEAALP